MNYLYYFKNNKVLERNKFQNLQFTDYFSNTYDDFSYLSNIPNKITYLPIYASITFNLHYLDYNATSSSLFIKY